MPFIQPQSATPVLLLQPLATPVAVVRWLLIEQILQANSPCSPALTVELLETLGKEN